MVNDWTDTVTEYWVYMQFLNSVKHPNSSRTTPAVVVKKNFIRPTLKISKSQVVKITYLPCLSAMSMIDNYFPIIDYIPAKGRRVLAETNQDYNYNAQLAYYD